MTRNFIAKELYTDSDEPQRPRCQHTNQSVGVNNTKTFDLSPTKNRLISRQTGDEVSICVAYDRINMGPKNGREKSLVYCVSVECM